MLPEAKKGEDRPAPKVVLHGIKHPGRDVQGDEQEDVGDEFHITGSLTEDREEHAPIPALRVSDHIPWPHPCN